MSQNWAKKIPPCRRKTLCEMRSSSSSFNSLKANTDQVQVQAVAGDNRNKRLENEQ